MRPPTYITPDGRDVVLELRPSKGGFNQFACLIDGEEEIVGSWDEIARYATKQLWKHVSTATARQRIAARA